MQCECDMIRAIGKDNPTMLSELSGSFNDMQRILLITALISTIFISACTTTRFPWVYRIDVEQGNVIDDEEKISQLKTGMTRRQVKYLLGTPMIIDTFNQDRWDYMYSLKTGKGILTRERITLTFNGDVLENIEKKEFDTVKVSY